MKSLAIKDLTAMLAKHSLVLIIKSREPLCEEPTKPIKLSCEVIDTVKMSTLLKHGLHLK